jgi:hypothetical protein
MKFERERPPMTTYVALRNITQSTMLTNQASSLTTSTGKYSLMRYPSDLPLKHTRLSLLQQSSPADCTKTTSSAQLFMAKGHTREMQRGSRRQCLASIKWLVAFQAKKPALGYYKRTNHSCFPFMDSILFDVSSLPPTKLLPNVPGKAPSR